MSRNVVLRSTWIAVVGLVTFGLPSVAQEGNPSQVGLSLVASSTDISSCSGDNLEVRVVLSNPSLAAIGGYQLFLKFPALTFEAVEYRASSVDGFVQVAAPAPLGTGFRPCDALPGSDGWADGAGDDVVAVIASAFGGGSTAAVEDAEVELGTLVLRPRGEPTDASGASIRLNEAPCPARPDPVTRIFDTLGDSLVLDPVDPLTVQVSSGGLEVQAFVCQEIASGVRLSWIAPASNDYLGYRIYRNGSSFASFPIKSVLGYEDKNPPAGTILYEIAVLFQGGTEGCRRSCEVSRDDGPRFVRGNANGDASVNITDGIAILDHLFGGVEIPCIDAGDVDDSGSVNITDAVALLNYLFAGDTGAPEPRPPYPDAGTDPTADSLGCDLPPGA